jgi:hypothetical protein
MTPVAATVAIFVALLLGYFFARWRRAEASLKSAKALADTAGQAAWRFRALVVLVAAAVYVVLHLWLGGRGR